mmetsp:Transcript_8241/g.21616  ORF Transcript_8241/g.21616 Transcript_8241/m.21616 type:complete len:202 (+) Transcript_8241:119-724(+)
MASGLLTVVACETSRAARRSAAARRASTARRCAPRGGPTLRQRAGCSSSRHPQLSSSPLDIAKIPPHSHTQRVHRLQAKCPTMYAWAQHVKHRIHGPSPSSGGGCHASDHDASDHAASSTTSMVIGRGACEALSRAAAANISWNLGAPAPLVERGADRVAAAAAAAVVVATVGPIGTAMGIAAVTAVGRVPMHEAGALCLH